MTRGRQAQRSIPRRLSNEEYLSQRLLPVRIYHQVAHEPTSVHWHEFYEVHFILAGRGTHLLNETTHQLVPGTLFLLTPADFHALIPQPDQPLELFNVIFAEEVLSPEMRQLLFSTPGELNMQTGEAARLVLEREFRCLRAEAEEQRIGYQLVMRGALERILLILRRNAVSTPSSFALPGESATSLPIRQALVYLQHHFREPLSLMEVARHAGLSPHYFSECFHKATGQTFQRYVQDLRVRFAHTLLGVSQLPVTVICSSAGFTSLAHFERVFKRRFGVSPRAYQQGCAKTSA